MQTLTTNTSHIEAHLLPVLFPMREPILNCDLENQNGE
jgi:hypothetical protein